MTSETIFKKDGDQQTSAATDDQTVAQGNQSSTDYNAIFSDKLGNIKNDQGEQKYSDVMTALEALNQSQQYIKTLESENKSYKESNVKNQTIEEVLDRIEATKTNQSTQTQTSQSNKEIDVDTFRRIAREENMLISRESQMQQNKKEVSDTLIKKFGNGDKALEAFDNKAKELGVDSEFLQDLASNSPKAVLAYFGNTTPTAIRQAQGTVNTESLNSSTQDKVEVKKVPLVGATQNEMLESWRSSREAVLAEMEN